MSPSVDTNLLGLRILETRLGFDLSAQPLLVYTQEAQEPFLGFFEDSTPFPYLTMQLCAWFLFFTFWIFFAGFRLFEPIVSIFIFPEVDNDGDLGYDNIGESLPFGRFGDHSPAGTIFYSLPWIFLFGPTYSILYLLFCPRSSLRWKHPKSLSFCWNLYFSAGLILCPMLTWIYCSGFRSLMIWVGFVGFYVLLGFILPCFVRPLSDADPALELVVG